MFPTSKFVFLLLFAIVYSNGQIVKLTEQLKQLREENNFKLLLEEIMIKSLQPYKCVAVITDPMHAILFEKSWFRRFKSFISYIMINVQEGEDLLSPYNETQKSLNLSKKEGCQLYIILIANGFQVARLLTFGDKYRVLNTRSNYIILFDNRLFESKLFYIWKRLINVIFIKEYGGLKNEKYVPWFELTTVPFPSPINTILIPRRLDIWASSKFRKGADLFRDKTADLRNQTLRIVAMPHLPGTVKSNGTKSVRTVRATMGNGSNIFTGTEVEILQTVSKSMNFKCEIYEAHNSEMELWGRRQLDGIYTGIIGEMVTAKADVALGDLYYTQYILDLMDLSVPYNTECLTFLTPDFLSDNSWKTLILPFTGVMWASVIICLIFCGIVFHLLARFHEHITEIKRESKRLNNERRIVTLSFHPQNKLNSNLKYTIMKEQYQPPKEEGQTIGLYQFSEPINSMLYTYSMLLLVSLPKLPSGWSLRMLTGWYWLYCLLLVVAYRASMTAILSQPTPRLTVDTLQELLDSKLVYGGWGEINRQFFKTSLDPTTKIIGENFEIVNNSEGAVDRVAEASFAFYENTYFLKEALVKRQIRYQQSRGNLSTNQGQEAADIARQDRYLHIMSDCIITMPVSLGLQKNSPIKPRVDKIIRRVLEAGLIKKWLDDAMQAVLNAEVQTENAGNKALMNMKKFFGALVALFIGYFISIATLIAELVYFHYKVKKNPNYNKYSRRIHSQKFD